MGHTTLQSESFNVQLAPAEGTHTRAQAAAMLESQETWLQML